MNSMQRGELNELSQQIIGAAYKVSNILGAGFLEKVYENALAHELQKSGLFVEQQKAIRVYYEGRIVGEFYGDLIVERHALVELKAVQSLGDGHHAQCLNYLKAGGYPICLLLNFGKPKVEVKRFVNKFM